MLIAIMIDTFDRAAENREDNRKLEVLKIMGKHIYLTVLDGYRERFAEYIDASGVDHDKYDYRPRSI